MFCFGALCVSLLLTLHEAAGAKPLTQPPSTPSEKPVARGDLTSSLFAALGSRAGATRPVSLQETEATPVMQRTVDAYLSRNTTRFTSSFAASSVNPKPAAAPAAAGPCKQLLVETKITGHSTDPKSKQLILNGTTTITNSGQFVVAMQRVGVRLCSKDADDGHLRQEAACPDYDVLSKQVMVCTWRFVLPKAPKTGCKLTDWTGIMSAPGLSISGERCPSPVVLPTTGKMGGSCSASY